MPRMISSIGHAGLRGPVQGVDDGHVVETVHLDGDAPVGAGRGLRVDELDHPVTDTTGRRDQLLVLRRLAEPGDVVEEPGHVGPQFGAGGQHTQVLVDAGRLGVVVAGAHMAVEPDGVTLLTHHQGRLGMGLQSHQSVDHVGARLLEGTGPPDVGLLVEPGGDLDQDGDLLAQFGGADQCGHDGAVTRRPVEALLDGEARAGPRPPRSSAPPPTPRTSRRDGGRGLLAIEHA